MPTEHEHNTQRKTQKEKTWWFSLPGLIAIILIAIIGYYIITEHRAHVAGFLGSIPLLLLLLLCPLMHIFMHGKHGGHGDNPPDKFIGRINAI